MMILSSLLGYFTLLGGCVLATLSVNSLLGQWICLEVNMLCIIPILVYSMTEDAILGGVKYFISQSAASLLFILALFITSEMSSAFNLMMAAILFKLGLPPMQSWLVSMLPSLSLTSMYMIFTVQKIIPLAILSFLKVSPVIYLLVGVSVLFFMVGAVSQVASVYMLMFFSSATNGAWALSSVGVGGQWILFMCAYSAILLSAMLCLSSMKVLKVGDLSKLSLAGGIFLSVQFLNLGGLPPLLGFLIKLMMMKQLMAVSFLLLSLLIVTSLCMLFMYTTFAHKAYCFNSGQKSTSGAGLGGYLTLSSLGASGLTIWFLI